MPFHAMMEFYLDLLRSKFWLIGDWSIVVKINSLGQVSDISYIVILNVIGH
jgi:hypothetical protein